MSNDQLRQEAIASLQAFFQGERHYRSRPLDLAQYLNEDTIARLIDYRTEGDPLGYACLMVARAIPGLSREDRQAVVNKILARADKLAIPAWCRNGLVVLYVILCLGGSPTEAACLDPEFVTALDWAI